MKMGVVHFNFINDLGEEKKVMDASIGWDDWCNKSGRT